MNIDAASARALIMERRASVLDVRTPEEFAMLGHIPGARLVPVQELALLLTVPGGPESAIEIARPDTSRRLIVVCEHGVRSRWACDALERLGVGPVANLSGGMSIWPFERERGLPEPPVSSADSGNVPAHGSAARDLACGSLPSGWLVNNVTRLRPGTALDVACGRGDNALLLARLGWRVTAVDRDADALAALKARSRAYGVTIDSERRDLEGCAGNDHVTGIPVGLPGGEFDCVVVTRFLHRPLMTALREAVRPGGAVVYETFTVGQRQFGRPTNPDYLLESGELRRAFEEFEVLAEREGVFDGRALSSIVARKPPVPDRARA